MLRAVKEHKEAGEALESGGPQGAKTAMKKPGGGFAMGPKWNEGMLWEDIPGACIIRAKA